MLRSAASDLGLHCLPMSHKKDVRLIWVKYENRFEIWNVLKGHEDIFEKQLKAPMLNVKTYLLHGKYVISVLCAYKLFRMILEFEKLCIIQVKCILSNAELKTQKIKCRLFEFEQCIKLEMVQRGAATYVTNRYHNTNNMTSVL